MTNVIYLSHERRKRARLGGEESKPPIYRRARREAAGENGSGLISIGKISADIVRRLRE